MKFARHAYEMNPPRIKSPLNRFMPPLFTSLALLCFRCMKWASMSAEIDNKNKYFIGDKKRAFLRKLNKFIICGQIYWAIIKWVQACMCEYLRCRPGAAVFFIRKFIAPATNIIQFFLSFHRMSNIIGNWIPPLMFQTPRSVWNIIFIFLTLALSLCTLWEIKHWKLWSCCD